MPRLTQGQACCLTPSWSDEMPVNELGWGTYPFSASLHAGHWAEESPRLARESGRYYLGCRGFARMQRPLGQEVRVAEEGDRAFFSRKDPERGLGKSQELPVPAKIAESWASPFPFLTCFLPVKRDECFYLVVLRFG